MISKLVGTARKLVQIPKGILAADEPSNEAGQRLQKVQVEDSVENRKKYKEMLFTTPNLNEYISGVIMNRESAEYQREAFLYEILQEQGIIPGINVDEGLEEISQGNTITKGLDDLKEKCKYYKDKRFEFTKWRSALTVTSDYFTILENATINAHYAKIAQDNGLMPIVEPDVSALGSHSIHDCFEISQLVYSLFMSQLTAKKVVPEGILFKINMITQGIDLRAPHDVELIGQYSQLAIWNTLPPAIPGVVFLSGGFSEQDSTKFLDSICMNRGYLMPYNLSFCFGRGLQANAMKEWKGEDTEAGQNAFLERCRLNSEAIIFS